MQGELASHSDEPTISIIVPTLNRGELVARQIRAIQSQQTGVNWELIVVDNGSSDGTVSSVALLAQRDPRVRLVEAAGRRSAAHARNVGAAAAKAGLLAFIDDDDLVGPGWLEAMVGALGEWPLVASRMEYERLNSARVLEGWPRTQVDRLGLYDGYPVCNAAIGIRSTLWSDLGGQNEDLLLGEDGELALRAARDFACAARLAPAALYHRQLPTTLRAAFRQGVRDGRGRVQGAVLQRGMRVMTRSDAVIAVRSYAWLVSRVPHFLLARRRYLWVLTLGERMGRLRESFARGVFIL